MENGIWTVIAAIIRHAATAGGAYLVTKGLITGDQATDLVGGAVVVAALAWSLIQKRLSHAGKLL